MTTNTKRWDKLPIGTVLLAPSGTQRRITCELFRPTVGEDYYAYGPYYTTERVDGRSGSFVNVYLETLEEPGQTGWTLDPLSFANHARRVDLSAAGFHSIDDPAFIEKRQRQAAALQWRVDAWAKLGLDRDAVLKRVAAVQEGALDGGPWATSTGAYVDRRTALDNAILFATGELDRA